MTTIVTVSHPSDDSDDMVTVHRQSVGGRRTAIGFNPSDHAGTRKLKALAAAFIEACHIEAEKLHTEDYDGNRCLATAMTHAESAQMFAVKGLHAHKNAS